MLYEMLVGRKLFEAETLPETLGAIFRQEIDLGVLPENTPPRLRRLVERCLERDPKIGTTVARYTIVSKLGGGGMGAP